MRIICSVCGSTNVEVRTWVPCNLDGPSINMTTFIEALVTKEEEIYPEDCWCCNCGEHTKLIISKEDE